MSMRYLLNVTFSTPENTDRRMYLVDVDKSDGIIISPNEWNRVFKKAKEVCAGNNKDGVNIDTLVFAAAELVKGTASPMLNGSYLSGIDGNAMYYCEVRQYQ